ncbi:MAG TPA: LTA synthase family protein [Tenuifilaceae bacterium]|nr:LTA synthase family protein [Tenuifilaceae bacterium]
MRKNILEKLNLNGNYYLILLWRFFLVMILFSITRVLFYLFNQQLFSEVTFSSFMRMLAGGLWFDTSAIIYTNVVYFVLALLPFAFRYKNWYQQVLKYLFIVTNSIVLGANCADFIYFRFTMRRTTTTVFSEFKHETNFGNLIPKFIIDYWYVFIIWILLIVILVVLYGKNRPAKLKQGFKNNIIPFFTRVAILLIFATFMVGGMRGGFRHSTRPITLSNAGQYVNEPLEAAIVLNTPFAIYRTIGKQSLQKVSFFKTEQELNAEYTPLHIPDSTSIPKKQNVVIFILESFGREYIGAYNDNLKTQGYNGFTPFLDSIIHQGLSYKYSFANGRKSIDAMPSILASIPMMVEPYFLTSYSGNKINSVASLLKAEGYYTAFFHGAPDGSMGFQAFANVAGFKDYFGMSEYPNSNDFDGMWGIWDEEFFQFFAQKLNTFKQPFCAAIFSVSSHHPFKVPERYEGKFPKGTLPIHHCIAYTDYSIKRFFETASKMPWYDSTLFVFTADHANQPYFPQYKTSLGAYAAPLVFYTPSGKLKGSVNQIAQQIDILPSVMGYLNYPKPFVAFGRNLFDGKSEPFAVSYTNNTYQLVMRDYLLLFDGKKSVGLYQFKTDSLLLNNVQKEHPEEVKQMEQKIKAIIQQYNSRMIEDNLVAK